MSFISSKSNKSRQGFTPCHKFQRSEISLFEKLNLNQTPQIKPIINDFSDIKSQSELISVRSRKRRSSAEFLGSSRIGGNTFLNRSILDKSSQDQEVFHNNELSESIQNMHHQKELSEISCPVATRISNQQRSFSPHSMKRKEPKFFKTKNLLRNMSSYLNKFLMYTKKGQEWIIRYFISQKRKRDRIQKQVKFEIREVKVEENFIDYSNSSDSKMKEDNQSKMRDQSENKKECDRDHQEQQLGQYLETNVKQFQKWISELSLINFADYELVWTKDHKYRGIYKYFCLKYYRQEAFCDIYRSRLKIKQISFSYTTQFIQGLLSPHQFYHFK